ncbi:hypothetical protein K8R47_01670, partial [archaeon]|nr:hypothetical protein [archaeon]
MIFITEILIPKEYFVGVDESNHGRYPEIYVAAVSSNPLDATPMRKIPKRRKLITLDTISRKIDDYVYTKITRDLSTYYERLAMKSQAISRLLISLELDPTKMFILIDGEGNGVMRKDISTIFNENQRKGTLDGNDILFAHKGDQTFFIVNA